MRSLKFDPNYSYKKTNQGAKIPTFQLPAFATFQLHARQDTCNSDPLLKTWGLVCRIKVPWVSTERKNDKSKHGAVYTLED